MVAPAPLLWGVSWVNMGPVAAIGPALLSTTQPVSLVELGLDGARMDATLDTYET